MGSYRDYTERDLRTPNAIATKIKFTRNYPTNGSLTFLLVEGETDKRLYQTYIDTVHCRIIVAFNKDAALKILSLLEAEAFPGVLAIVDADFDVLEGKQPASPNLFFTDAHDLEMMVIRSPAFDRVLAELGSEEKIDTFRKKHGKDVLVVLLEIASSIGYLRWVSLRENLAFTFEGLSFDKFVEKENLTFDLLKLIRIVQSRSQQRSFADHEVHQKILHLCSDGHDPWHVCCGHDVVEILALGLRKVIGTRRVTEPEEIEMCLRLAYDSAYFRKTHLYRSLQHWQESNTPFLVLITE